jgi:hypothetical protein
MATEKFINELKNRANANRLGRFELQMYDRFEKEFKGDTYQKKYQGYNLLQKQGFSTDPTDTTYWNISNCTVTPLEDGWARITATNNTSSTMWCNVFVKKPNADLLPNTQYTLVVEVKNFSGYTNYKLAQGHPQEVWTINRDVARDKTTQQKFLNVTKADLGDSVLYALRTFFTLPANKTGTADVRIMILKGDYRNIDTEYEPYVGGMPSPSPDYPQEIQSVTGLQKVNITGKNLFNFNTFISSSNMVVIDSSSSNSLVARVTQASTWATVRYRIFNLKENTNYSLKYDFENSYNSELYKHTWVVVRNPITGDNIYNDSYYKNDVVTFNTGDNKYLDLIFQVTINAPAVINTLTITNIQLEQGSTATTYEPYKGNTYEVNLGKNLLDTSNAESRTHNGITFTLDNDGSITANGTATSLAFMLVLSQAQSPLYKAGNYAFSLVNEMPNNCYARFEFFDSNNTMILRKNITKQDTATLSQDCYLKVSYVITSGTVLNNFVNYIQLEKGSIATSYSPYFTPIELNRIPETEYEDSIKKSSGKNLFDKSTAIVGKNWNGDNMVYSIATDYIEVEEGKTYVISTTNMSSYSSTTVVKFDSNKNVVLPAITTNPFTVPEGIKYIKLSIRSATSHTWTQSELDNAQYQLEQNSQATSYEPYGKVWYIEKNIGKVILDGSETWSTAGSNDITARFYTKSLTNNGAKQGLSSYFRHIGYLQASNTNEGFSLTTYSTNCYININKSRLSEVSANGIKTWLSSNNVEVVYPLATPTTTEITNTELISQLEAIELLKGENNITITSENLPIIFDYSFWNGDTEIDVDDRFLKINQSNHLTTIELKDSCCVNNNILGTTYTKSAEVELLDLPMDTKLEGKTIIPEVGVRYDDDTTEYETFDNFTIESLNDEQTASNTKFTAMSGGTLLDSEYICSLSFENGQTHTINEFYQDALSQIGITPTDTTFDNSEIEMTGNPFTNKESIRILISEVEKVSCTIIDFDWKNKTASMTWLSDQIDYEFNTSDYSTLEGSLAQYGPLNTIIIANTELNGENVVMKDDISVVKDGEHQIIIDSPYFLYTEALRRQAIEAIYNKLVGLTYYDIKLTTPYGKPFLKLGNKIRINTNEGQTYDTYVLTHTLTYDGTIQSIIESPALTQEEQTIQNNIKNNTIKERVRRTELMVDKTTGDITAITDRVTTVENEFGDVYSKEEVNTLVQNSATGITNTFVNSGGNNLLRNTGLWFEDRSTIEYMYPRTTGLYPSDELYMSADPHWEYWKGNAKKVKEDKAANMSGILLQTGYFEQTQQVRNGTYTLSFKYRKLVELATVNVQINDRYLDLTNIEDTEIIEVGEITAQNISIKIFSDTDDSCVIYDLMLNAGSEKAEYSQHQNETTTDTVNISKGITIQSSDTNTTFKANSDGIRVYNSRDMDTPITEYTDTGMDTNRIKVKDEAEIIQVLWKNVGNNTWISRL